MKILLTTLLLYVFTTSIYSLEYQDIDGATQSMNQYQGKKILLVNIATSGPGVGQLSKLQALQQTYSDSLVVIGFPSNSFGHETRTNAQIKEFCQTNYGVTFRLAAKNPTDGLGIQPIYQWLTNSIDNGVISGPVKNDFQKYLINESGMLIGVFAPSVDPLSPQITGAITNQ